MEVLFHVDSGAGQSLCCCADAFFSLTACAIEVVGVSGTLPIYGAGTAAFSVVDTLGVSVTLLIHNCLLSQGGVFNLLSVSQIQMSRLNSVDFATTPPCITLQSRTTMSIVPLHLIDGLYSVTMAHSPSMTHVTTGSLGLS